MSDIVESRIDEDVEHFLRAARAGNLAQCKGALEGKAELINAVEAGGYAALHFAAFNENLQLIDLLAQFKPDLNIQNFDLNTPLMLAAKMKKHDAIRRLVELGADVNFVGRSGTTAAHHAAAMGHTATVKLLVDLGANLSATVGTEAGSVLHWACHSGETDVVATLLHDYHMHIDDQDAHGGTPLFVACHLRHSDLILFLLERGANPNIAAKDQSTPLHFVAENGKLDDVKVLLAFGAKTDSRDSEGKTPVDLAESKGNKESRREMEKPQLTAEKRKADADRFKAHGNKVFLEGENVKASKFYSLAIANDPTNHVFFSNRSACYFNMRQYVGATNDAKQCIALNSKWGKGYFRLAASQNALKQYEAAKETVRRGLEVEPANADLKKLADELSKK